MVCALAESLLIIDMKLLKYILTLIIYFNTLNASHAQITQKNTFSEIDRDFKIWVFKPAQALIDQGVTQIGAVDLILLKKDIFEKVSFLTSPSFNEHKKEHSNDDKLSSFHWPSVGDKKGYVMFDYEAASNRKKDSLMQALFLHEAIGAAGYVDNSCEISCPIFVLGDRTLSRKNKNLFQRNQNTYKLCVYLSRKTRCKI